MGEIVFLFGIHNHQPIGNLENVFEEAYEKSYLPFLKVVARHPAFRWNLHCTGILWEWLEQKHPEYGECVAKMIEEGRCELLSGGYYEPILPVIPDRDKTGQIQKLNQFLKNRFKVSPKGMWCAERVWEPHLPKPIREAQLEYTLLDDTHFLSAGMSPDQLHGYYKVEEENNVIDIFPISKELRYLIPFEAPEKTIEWFKKIADKKNDRLLSFLMADDGEKFGFWPKTHKRVYEDRWLEHFLELLEKNSSWLKTDTISNFRKKNKSEGRVYLPCASYFEMSEWSLPTKSAQNLEKIVDHLNTVPEGGNIKNFIQGGIWRNFLAKYDESNLMHKKMLRISKKLHTLEKSLKNFKHHKKNFNQAYNYLWGAQCNCAYWHGVFGGLYLPFLRQAVFKNLILAEKMMDLIAGSNEPPKEIETETLSIKKTDFDGDGEEEILIETPIHNFYIAPHKGGAIFELDFKKCALNITNVLTRRTEHYHDKILKNQQKKEDASEVKTIHQIFHSKEKNIHEYLNVDWYQRLNLLDHFLHPHTTTETFIQCRYGEQGDFVLGDYAALIKIEKESLSLKLRRDGVVWVDDQKKDVRILKEIKFIEPHLKNLSNQNLEFKILYKITNLSKEPTGRCWFAPEFNFSFSTPETKVSHSQLKIWQKKDPHFFWQMSVEFSELTDLWTLPLETVSNSESGFEKTFQGIIFLPHWKFSLEPDQSFERSLNFRLE